MAYQYDNPKLQFRQNLLPVSIFNILGPPSRFVIFYFRTLQEANLQVHQYSSLFTPNCNYCPPPIYELFRETPPVSIYYDPQNFDFNSKCRPICSIPPHCYQEFKSTFNMLMNEAFTLEIYGWFFPASINKFAQEHRYLSSASLWHQRRHPKSRFWINTSLLDFTTQISSLCL